MESEVVVSLIQLGRLISLTVWGSWRVDGHQAAQGRRDERRTARRLIAPPSAIRHPGCLTPPTSKVGTQLSTTVA